MRSRITRRRARASSGDPSAEATLEAGAGRRRITRLAWGPSASSRAGADRGRRTSAGHGRGRPTGPRPAAMARGGAHARPDPARIRHQRRHAGACSWNGPGGWTATGPWNPYGARRTDHSCAHPSTAPSAASDRGRGAPRAGRLGGARLRARGGALPPQRAHADRRCRTLAASLTRRRQAPAVSARPTRNSDPSSGWSDCPRPSGPSSSGSPSPSARCSSSRTRSAPGSDGGRRNAWPRHAPAMHDPT